MNPSDKKSVRAEKKGEKNAMKRKDNVFANRSEQDFKEMNEQSKRAGGLSNLTFEDVYGKKTEEKVEEIRKNIED